MKKILILSLLLALGGCVVVPAHQAYYQPATVVVEPDPVYVWDAAVGAFFFIDIYGHRSYMHHGWAPRGHGYRH